MTTGESKKLKPSVKDGDCFALQNSVLRRSRRNAFYYSLLFARAARRSFAGSARTRHLLKKVDENFTLWR